MFDLRHLEHSTIIYEDPAHHPLLRLAWNKQDPNYLATMAMDGMEACILVCLFVVFTIYSWESTVNTVMCGKSLPDLRSFNLNTS